MGAGIMALTQWIIVPSVIFGTSGSMIVRIIQLAVPVSIRNEELVRRTGNLNWIKTIPLKNIVSVRSLDPVDSPTIMGMFAPAEGYVITHAHGKEEMVEVASEPFLSNLRELAPQAKFL